jgi:hypothetical protein
MPRSSDRLLLRFAGAPMEPHSVPAAELARALDGFQRIVHLIGMRLEGRTLSRRARPSKEVQQRFVLVCDLPYPGSFEQPVRLMTLDPQLLSVEELERADADLTRFLRAVGQIAASCSMPWPRRCRRPSPGCRSKFSRTVTAF